MSGEQLSHHRLDPTWPEEVGAALAIGTLLFLSPLLRPWYRRWGTPGGKCPSLGDSKEARSG
jgi:hypothetical protein